MPYLLHSLGCFFLAYVAVSFLTSVCRLLTSVAEMARCETPFLEVADSKPISSKVLLIRGLFLSSHFVFWLFFAKSCLASGLKLRFILILVFCRILFLNISQLNC